MATTCTRPAHTAATYPALATLYLTAATGNPVTTAQTVGNCLWQDSATYGYTPARLAALNTQAMHMPAPHWRALCGLSTEGALERAERRYPALAYWLQCISY